MAEISILPPGRKALLVRARRVVGTTFKIMKGNFMAVEPFARSLREGIEPAGTLGVGLVLLAGGLWLSFSSDERLLGWLSAIAPKLAPWVILALRRVVSVVLLIAGAICVRTGDTNLHCWWLCSPFVWRTIPIDDDGACRVEERPVVRTLSDLVLGSIASVIALLAGFVGLAFVVTAARVDGDLAPFVAQFVNGGVGRYELIIGRVLLIAAAMIAGLAALNRGQAASLHFDAATLRIEGGAS